MVAPKRSENSGVFDLEVLAGVGEGGGDAGF
jgi:hypothetical protein